MTAPLQKLRPGQPFRASASTWNAFVKNVEDTESLINRFGGGALGAGPLRTTLVLVKNSTGAQVERFGVLGISAALLTPANNPEAFADDVVLNGVTPVVADHANKFVVTAEPIEDGKIGAAYILGCFWAKVNVGNESHTHAKVKASAVELESSSAGPAFVVWKETGTGAGKKALVLVGAGGGTGPQFVFVSGASGSGGSATTQASWTYTISRDEAGSDVIASGVAKEGKRPVGPMLAAGAGTLAVARENSGGTWVLCDIFDEVIGSVECVPEP